MFTPKIILRHNITQHLQTIYDLTICLCLQYFSPNYYSISLLKLNILQPMDTYQYIDTTIIQAVMQAGGIFFTSSVKDEQFFASKVLLFQYSYLVNLFFFLVLYSVS